MPFFMVALCAWKFITASRLGSSPQGVFFESSSTALPCLALGVYCIEDSRTLSDKKNIEVASRPNCLLKKKLLRKGSWNGWKRRQRRRQELDFFPLIKARKRVLSYLAMTINVVAKILSVQLWFRFRTFQQSTVSLALPLSKPLPLKFRDKSRIHVQCLLSIEQ